MKSLKFLHDLFDLKLNAMVGLFFTISFSNVEFLMKVVVFVLTVGYMVRKWYFLEKNKGE